MKLFLYVMNTLADWEIGYLTAEIRSRRFFSKENIPCDIITVSNDKSAIITMGGMRIVPDIEAAKMDIGDDDILVLPGSDEWMKSEHDAILNLAKRRIVADKAVAAICGATAGLARVGALNEKKHTSNAMEYLKYTCADYLGESRYVNFPAVNDRHLITASGLSPLDFTCEILKELRLFKPDTLSAWKMLNETKDPRCFFELMNSLK